MTRQPLLNLTAVTPKTATEPVAEILNNTQLKLGFIPNMYGYMGVLPGVLEGYFAAYASFRNDAGFTPPEQETVFLSVSAVNGCTYCTAAHSMIADKLSKVPAGDLAALRNGTPLPDPRLNALAIFTRSMVEKRGMPEKSEVDTFLAAGFTPKHVLGIVQAIACKTYSNFVNHLAATEVDAAFADYKVTA
ncbi:carboxymuconolactone decarboxylase family protein [Profundibacter sp.]|uniref:carboxymuconolactone decarboxylase family protein n=1 Tax=Profundibacter sp. TaxID=3101071 RepID=UPI003D0DFE30